MTLPARGLQEVRVPRRAPGPSTAEQRHGHDAGGALTVATGLRLLPRGATGDATSADLRVTAIRPVALPQEPALEARDARGGVWRRLWLRPDRMVVEYTGFAVAEVHDDGSIVFDRELPPDLEQHLVLDHLLALELARRGHVVLHGAVLAIGDRAAVLVGPSGAGKSTLTAYAGQQGWTVGGDDGAVLHVAPSLTVEPTYPTIRLTPDACELLDIPVSEGAEVVGKRRFDDAATDRFRQQPARLCLVAEVDPVPAGRPGELSLLRGVDAHLALFGSAFHADLGGGPLMRDVFDRLAAVAGTTHVGRLAVPRGRAGLAEVEQLLRQEVTR